MDNEAGSDASSWQRPTGDAAGMKSPLCSRMVQGMVDPTVSADVPCPGHCQDPSAALSWAGWISLLLVPCQEESLWGWKAAAVAAGMEGNCCCLLPGPCPSTDAQSAAPMVHVVLERNKWCLAKCKPQPAPLASSALNGTNQSPPNYYRLQKWTSIDFSPQLSKE